MKRAAVLPSAGLGDALLMMIVSHRLFLEGYEVTTYHPGLSELQNWFPGHIFAEQPTPSTLSSLFASVDLLIVQNDNSPKIKALLEIAQNERKKLSIFYPTYLPTKHAPLSQQDQVFKTEVPMAENLSQAVARLLSSREISKNNGLKVPEGFVHRRYPSRIILHPTSSHHTKNWSPKKYIEVALELKKRGFSPFFSLSQKERESWKREEVEIPEFSTLSEAAGFIYESGYMIGNDSLIGHLASNLHIPTLIIADNRERMQLWRPGWLQGEVITPPSWVPNWKGLRLKERHWQRFISKRQVLSSFINLARHY